LVGLFVWVTACTSYHQIELGEVADHGKVRVTLTSGERETLHDPALTADSIKGDTGPPKYEAYAFSTDNVAMLEGSTTNVAGTVGLVLGLGLVVILVVGAVQYSQMDLFEEGLFDDM
jgi:hypothetical protein